MLVGRMSQWQLTSVEDGSRNLHLKFGQNRVNKSWDILGWTNVARTNVAWINVAWTNVTVTVGICWRWFQKPTFKVRSKSGKQQLRYSWYGQMLSGQMFPGQMSSWQSESAQEPTFKVWSKLGQLQLRYYGHWVCVVDGVGWGGVMGWYAQSFLCLTSNCSWVEVTL